MSRIDYLIQPVLMGGLVKETDGDLVKIHLHGRLGVITVPRKVIRGNITPEPGHEMQFYFSYFQVTDQPLDYDDTPMTEGEELIPCLLGGNLTEVNDTAVKLRIMDGLGSAAVPRRWVFTDVKLTEGLFAEFYFSGVRIIGKRKIPVEQI
ncbi:MAG: CBO2463/CBO2479 domain-containing protein [Candidatus Weimeria sp.]